jgi:multicomponent Na+:H+ antiporter subunit D
MFFAAGAIERVTGRTQVHELGGVGRQMPWTMAAFSVAALSFIGVPLFAGFVTKWYLSLGGLQAGAWWVVALMALSGLLNAAYWLPILYLAWFKRSEPSEAPIREAPALLILPTLVSSAYVLLLGTSARVPGMPYSLAEAVVRFVTRV